MEPVRDLYWHLLPTGTVRSPTHWTERGEKSTLDHSMSSGLSSIVKLAGFQLYTNLLQSRDEVELTRGTTNVQGHHLSEAREDHLKDYVMQGECHIVCERI